MGAVGGLLGLGGGQNGTGANITPGTNPQQLAASYQGNQNALAQQYGLLGALQNQNGLQNQSNVYNQNQAIVSGQGPNPAQAMLNQATGQNVANQAALMAGQRGASANPALIARQAAQQGANLQQQAAGQGATMQANQSLAALQNAGNIANTQVANQIGATQANTAAQQGEQAQLMGANNAYNQVEGGLAQTTMQGQQGLLGGALNTVGGAVGSIFGAEGGIVPGYARGGGVGSPQSAFAKNLFNMTGSNSQNSGASALQQGMTNLGANIFNRKPSSSQVANAGLPQAQQQFQNMVAPDSSDVQGLANAPQAAKGGQVPVILSPGELKLNPDKAKAVADGKANPMAVGEKVPGKPKVKGDSYKNDTFATKAKPGSVIIPNSVMQSKDPVRGAAEFVRDVMAKKRQKA